MSDTRPVAALAPRAPLRPVAGHRQSGDARLAPALWAGGCCAATEGEGALGELRDRLFARCLAVQRDRPGPRAPADPGLCGRLSRAWHRAAPGGGRHPEQWPLSGDSCSGGCFSCLRGRAERAAWRSAAAKWAAHVPELAGKGARTPSLALRMHSRAALVTERFIFLFFYFFNNRSFTPNSLVK